MLDLLLIFSTIQAHMAIMCHFVIQLSQNGKFDCNANTNALNHGMNDLYHPPWNIIHPVKSNCSFT
jgi:hypothetical protein